MTIPDIFPGQGYSFRLIMSPTKRDIISVVNVTISWKHKDDFTGIVDGNGKLYYIFSWNINQFIEGYIIKIEWYINCH